MPDLQSGLYEFFRDVTGQTERRAYQMLRYLYERALTQTAVSKSPLPSVSIYPPAAGQAAALREGVPIMQREEVPPLPRGPLPTEASPPAYRTSGMPVLIEQAGGMPFQRSTSPPAPVTPRVVTPEVREGPTGQAAVSRTLQRELDREVRRPPVNPALPGPVAPPAGERTIGGEIRSAVRYVTPFVLPGRGGEKVPTIVNRVVQVGEILIRIGQGGGSEPPAGESGSDPANATVPPPDPDAVLPHVP